MSKAVVFARSIRPEWLDKTVELIIALENKDKIKAEINAYLANYIESPTVLRKTREILLNTWVSVEDKNEKIRDRAVQEFKQCSAADRLALHWGMLLLAFPIFKDLCSIIGKLSEMQNEMTNAQIKRRIYEIWGERTTLLHSLSKNIKTLKDFEVIEQVRIGVYKPIRRTIKSKEVACILLYATLKVNDKLYYSLANIDKFMELYPFDFEINIDDLYKFDLVGIDRMGGEPVISINN